MSGGKKHRYKKQKQTYTIGEVRRMIHQCTDEATKKVILLCVTAARDQFDMDEDTLVEFMARMQRYVDYEKDKLISIEDSNKSL